MEIKQVRCLQGVIACLMLIYFAAGQAYAQGCIYGCPGYITPLPTTTLRVVGKGIEPERAKTRAQAILMAERAAVADGYRLMTEKIYGVYVDSLAYINNGSVAYSLSHNETQAWVRGAEIVQINRLSNGITEAEMVLRLPIPCCGNRCCPAPCFKSTFTKPGCYNFGGCCRDSKKTYYEEKHSIKYKRY
ncbi:LPP20 family lipoprotein [Desulfobacter latus]|uniref:Lipoprotein n=1 Tax=Desulfobacter latus TaxID=2292 RepID=A0A850T7N1_9BACT|nr:hypothetical protein [Desulfobacter latus]NWH05095.1 hypothetical protein [Desulfobacter latus]